MLTKLAGIVFQIGWHGFLAGAAGPSPNTGTGIASGSGG